jgi:DNA-directed RNA polymerase sigma subunit (sigma70/sigma32)
VGVISGRSELVDSLPPAVVERWLSSLPERYRFVAERRFGLNGHEPEVLETIGPELKGVGVSSTLRYDNPERAAAPPGLAVSRERVRQIEARSLRLLKQMLRDEGT